MRERDREIARLSRLYDALSRINRVIAQTSTREALLSEVCRVLVEHGGFRMSWIGWHRPETHEIVPVASCGEGQAYAEAIQVYGDDRPEGRGPTGVALREGRPYVCNDFFSDRLSGLPDTRRRRRRGRAQRLCGRARLLSR
jgi:two-component system sensor histidine kinase/response regulator